MSKPAQFWIPSLFRIDRQMHGRLQQPIVSPGSRDGTTLASLGISRKFLEDMLDSYAHSFEALFLAGYKVPWIEFGLQRIQSVPLSATIWIRVDLQSRQIEVNTRADSEQTNRVRMKILPIQTADRSYAIDMSQPTLTEVMGWMIIGTQAARDVLDAPMMSYLERALAADPDAPGSILQNGSAELLTAEIYRQNVVSILSSSLESDGICDLPLAFEVKPDADSDAKSATRIVFKAFGHALFDTITWIAGHAILSETKTFLQASTAEGSQLQFGEGTNLPGMLWVLNPVNWAAVWPETQGIRDLPAVLEEVQSVAQLIFTAVVDTDEQMFSDLLMPDATVTDPPVSSYVEQKRAGFLYGLIYGSGLEIAQDPAIAVSLWYGAPMLRIIDLLLGHSARTSRAELRKANRADDTKPIVVANPYMKTNESIEGLLHTRLLGMLTVDEAPAFLASEVDNYVQLFFRAYRSLLGDYGDSHRYDDPESSISPGAATKIARNESYLTVILSLFNYGIFTIEQFSGDLNEDLEVPAVEVFEDYSEGSILGDGLRRLRFKHTLYELPGFLVRQRDPVPGLTLDDLVCWEYVTAQPEPPVDLRDALVAAGLFPADNRDRLILVAGPGISINETQNWPAAVDLEIIRVQSPALVPDWNERIDVKSITAPYTIGILDDINHISRTNILDEIDRRHAFQNAAREHPERLPFVTVSSVRKDGKCGVTLSTQYPSSPYYLGLDGTAAVEILVDEKSGSDRFAFDIRYDIHKIRRAVGTHTEEWPVYEPGTRISTGYTQTVSVTDYETVDVAQFEIIVQATDGVEVRIDDNKIGPVYDALVAVFGNAFEQIADPVPDTFRYEVWRTDSFQKVPVQGVILTPNMPGFFADPEAYELRNNAAIVEDLELIIDMTVGMVPIVGEAVDIIELTASLYTGTDKWGRPITNFDRMLIVGGLALPLVSGKTLRVVKGQLPADTLFKAVTGLDAL